MRPISEKVRLGKYLRGLLVASDFLTLNIAFFLVVLLLRDVPGIPLKIVWLLANVSLVPSELLFSSDHNVRIVYADRVLLNAFKSTLVFACVSMTLVYIFDLEAVKFSYCLLFYCIFYVLLSLWWVIYRSLLKHIRRIGFNFRRVVIVGSGPTGRAVFKELCSDAGYGYRIMGIFDKSYKDTNYVFGDTFYGVIDEIPDFVHLNKIDVIYYTLDAEDSELISRMITLADEEGADFVYVPKFNSRIAGQFESSSLGNIPTMTHTLSPLHRRPNRLVKRVTDLLISVPFLIVSPIIFLPIALGIKLTSKGPVFFKQKRTGIYGSEFVCYKFRTMRVNADSDRLQATEDDPRKTRFGDFLRRSSLDELPQFVNVFLGNMSVVGPRPHMISHTEEYSALIDKYMVRHAVKPGITGWAQVNGYRGGTKELWQMEKRVEFDVWYIRNWNIFLDIKIIFLTMLNGLRSDRNAY